MVSNGAKSLIMVGGSKVTYINKKPQDCDGVQTLKAKYRSEMVAAPFSI